MPTRLVAALALATALALALVTAATAAPISRTATLISQPTGLADPNFSNVTFGGASDDGARVFFTTTQKLTADDLDSNRTDVYERSGGTTKLVSATTGVFDPNQGAVTFEGASDDGTRVFFTTTQRMTTDDVDNDRIDVYERSAGTTKLVSAPQTIIDPDTAGATFAGASADGTHVFFETNQQLTTGDTDGTFQDIYERFNGATFHTSEPSGLADPNTAGVDFQAVDDDGVDVFMTTTQKLVTTDLDANLTDVYRSSGAGTHLISAPDGVADSNTANAAWGGLSPNGDHAFFTTTQKMTTDDGDTNRGDVYRRTRTGSTTGTTTLMSQHTGVAEPDSADAIFSATSGDGSRVVFATTQEMTTNDDDANRIDLYERAAGTTSLVSAPTGVVDPDDAGASFKYASTSNARIFFDSDESLTTDDGDAGAGDIYQRSGGITSLVSKPTGIADPNNAPVSFAGASEDGTRVFLSTGQQLTSDDADGGDQDIYERHDGVTTLISKPTGVADPNNAGADFGVATPDGESVFYSTTQAFTSQDVDTNRTDVYMAADVTPPDTSVTAGPSGATGDSTPTFSFSSADAGATFQCKVDGGAFAACSSPFTTAALVAGAHSFQVRAVDNVGNVDASPAVRAFTLAAAGGPGGPGGAGGADSTAPLARLSGKRTQKLGKSVAVTVTCVNEACRAVGTASTNVPVVKAKRFGLKRTTKSIRSGSRATLKLKLSAKARRAIKRALRKRRKVRVKVKVTVADAAGNARVLRRTVRLKR